MRSEERFFHCGEFLRETLASEIGDVRSFVSAVRWEENFNIEVDGKGLEHQAGYIKALEQQFLQEGWESQPVPRHCSA